MSESLVANRYAKALYRANKDKHELIKKNLEVLSTMAELFEDEKIRKVLISPVMPDDLKKDILNYAIQKAGGGEDIKHFVKAIVDSGRVAVVSSIAKAYRELINEKEGVVDANVTTVVALSDADLEKIANSLTKTTSKKVNVTQTIDKSILGGFIVRIGNSLVDLSLKSKLDAMAQNAVR